MPILRRVLVSSTFILAFVLMQAAPAHAGRARNIQAFIDRYEVEINDAALTFGIPPSIIVAMAAEGLWGGSTFAKQINAFFGQTVSEEFASPTVCVRNSKNACIKKFPSFQASLRAMVKNLCSHPAYVRGIKFLRDNADTWDVKKAARFLEIIGPEYNRNDNPKKWVSDMKSLLVEHDLIALDLEIFTPYGKCPTNIE